MPGNDSALDRNDFQMLERLTRQVGRLADEIERLNDNIEADVDEQDVRSALDMVLGTKAAGELVEEAGGPMAALGMLSVEGQTKEYKEVRRIAGLDE